LQAVAQQTPSAQKPVTHWASAVQVRPTSARVLQVPLAQYALASQPESSVQS
jgi:hypothetical protein